MHLCYKGGQQGLQSDKYFNCTGCSFVQVLPFKPGQRVPTGRPILRRVADALPSLGRFVMQYCGCEAINAWLMQQGTGKGE
jgi:hypothetical protein